MVLDSYSGWKQLMRILFLGSLVYGVLMIAGCGSSEEATISENEGFDDQPLITQQTELEEAPDQQALTSFIGAAPKKEEPVVQQEAPPPAPVTVPSGDVQTENTSLKQKVVRLEQDLRTLNARISDTEVKYMAQKERAERAEEAARVAAQSAAISARSGQVVMETITPSSEASMRAYEIALQQFKGRKYDDAIVTLQNMISAGVSKNLEDNCHYWIGESNFGKKNYKEAMSHFEMVFEYENSEKLADARFMLAQCFERTGNKMKAKESYERVVNDFPMSRLVQRAKERSARF
jgi:tol-pal system protein YbgF